MEDVKKAVRDLKHLSEEEKLVQKEDANDSLEILLVEAKKNGLSEDILDVCCNFLVLKCHTGVLADMVLRCMIPKTNVPDHIVSGVLLWICEHYRVSINSAILYGLQWIAGLLEFGLTNEKPVNEYYHMFISLLDWPILENIACWLVVRFTKPDDVTRDVVTCLLMTGRETNSKSRNIILWCYKTLKPECVPEPIETPSIHSTLELNPLIKQHFAMAHQRINGGMIKPNPEE